MAISRIDKMVREIRRTASLREVVDLRNVDVDIFPAADDPVKIAAMTLSATALSLRCFRGQVRIHLPSATAPGLSWDCAPLAELLVSGGKAYGGPARVILDESRVGPWRLGLGRRIEDGFFADASNWRVGVNQVFSPGSASATPAAVFATCCAFAKLFSAAVLRDRAFASEEWTFSLGELGPGGNGGDRTVEVELELGKIGLLGAGAIGSGFAYTLWLSAWKAQMEIIDKDFYDEPNQETTMFVGQAEVRRNRKKAIALADLARRPGLETRGMVEKVEAGHSILSTPRDVFVCAVDNAETRGLLDSVNAPVLLNSGLGGQPEDAGHLVWTSHSEGEPKLSSRYRKIAEVLERESTPPTDFEDDCSRLAYREVSLAAPFMGLAAGALLVAGCALRARGRHQTANYFKIDLLRLQSRYQSECLSDDAAIP